jgi:cyanophycin synthetase
VAGPGDRRDEDLHAIANAVAGRFDHYICRRDDNLRDRAPDEVPRLIATALIAEGVANKQISIVPDEQEAIDAALNMGQPGDLLLVFADALVRSWKQITKFRPAGAPEPQARAPTPPPPTIVEASSEPPPLMSLEGLLRDERGIRLAPEVDD